MKKPKKPNPPPSGAAGHKSQGGPGVSAPGSAPGSSPAKSASAVVEEVDGEPMMKRAPVPAPLIALLGALVYWGSMYILEYGGEADARVHYPYTSFKELQDYQPKDPAEIAKAKGLRIYLETCGKCHQNDGNGSVSQGVPPLAGSDWPQAKDPSRVIRIVLNGLSGPLTVNGKEWGMTAMLPWRDIMSDEDIAAVLSYVRSAWGNKAPAVKPEDVKKIRAETTDKTGNWSAQELLKIPLKE